MNTHRLKRFCDHSNLFLDVIKSNIEYMDETCWLRLCEQATFRVLSILEENVNKLGDECWITLCYYLVNKYGRFRGDNPSFIRLFELIESNADLLPKECFRKLGEIGGHRRIYNLIQMFDE